MLSGFLEALKEVEGALTYLQVMFLFVLLALLAG